MAKRNKILCKFHAPSPPSIGALLWCVSAAVRLAADLKGTDAPLGFNTKTAHLPTLIALDRLDRPLFVYHIQNWEIVHDQSLVRAETSGVQGHFRIDCYVPKLGAPKLLQRDLAWVPIENAKRWTNGISVSIFICTAPGPMTLVFCASLKFR